MAISFAYLRISGRGAWWVKLPGFKLKSVQLAIKRATYNTALQTDKVNLSYLLHPQRPRELAFAAELGRYTP
jgi:hypothetical protein